MANKFIWEQEENLAEKKIKKKKDFDSAEHVTSYSFIINSVIEINSNQAELLQDWE